MKPTETSYTLAGSSKDYADCHTLQQAESGSSEHSFSFPTVIARRNGEIIGFLSTIPPKDRVIAGPLVIKGGRNPVVVLRLIEAYERVMRGLGIKLYYFCVAAERSDAFSVKRMEEMGFKFWETLEGYSWMKREL